MRTGTVVALRGKGRGIRSEAWRDVPQVIARLHLSHQEVADQLNRQLGIDLVSAGLVRLWADGHARPPRSWIDELVALTRRPAPLVFVPGLPDAFACQPDPRAQPRAS